MPQDNQLIGTDGPDELVPLPGVTYIDGGAGVDVLFLDRSGDVTGGSQADYVYNMDQAASEQGTTLVDGTVIKNVENVSLKTGPGDDTLSSSNPNASFDWEAGGGMDSLVLDYSGATKAVAVVSEDHDHGVNVAYDTDLSHASHIESLWVAGGSGDDILSGTTGNDTMNGGAGNDIIVTTQGIDHIDGGDGDDSVGVDHMDWTSNITFNGQAATTSAGLTMADGLSIKNAEQLVFLSGAGDDKLVGGAYDDYLNGGNGNDSLWGAGGDDRLYGGNGNDWLSGGDGKDSLNGGAGADTMIGGGGNDTYYVDNAGDKIMEGQSQGDDDVVYSSVSYSIAGEYVETLILTGNAVDGIGNGLGDKIVGNAVDNDLRGGAGSDQLYGMDGNDLLGGGTGGDHMWGGAGDDTYNVTSTNDVVSEHMVGNIDDGGTDTVKSSVSYSLGAYIENLTLTKYQAIDGTGNSLDNVITGNDAKNVLKGGAGDDVLRGMGGNDTLTGGDGGDTFRFEAAGMANGLDHVTDFVSGVDHLAFDSSAYNFVPGHQLSSDEFHVNGAVGTNAQFIYNTVNHTLYWDADGTGSGGAVSVAVFDNHATLHASDFMFE